MSQLRIEGKVRDADSGSSYRVLVKADDTQNFTATVTLISTAAATNNDPFADNSASGMGFALSLNDIRGGALAQIDDAIVRTPGRVTVEALHLANVTAVINATVESSGGSLVGGSGTTSLAASGVISTNTVLGGATALVTNSDVETSGIGDVVVSARG